MSLFEALFKSMSTRFGLRKDSSSVSFSHRKSMVECMPYVSASACSNLQLPANGKKGANWSDPLPSGQSKSRRVRSGLYTLTCQDSRLSPMVECIPSACSNMPLPANGKKAANWSDPLPSGNVEKSVEKRSERFVRPSKIFVWGA